MKTYKTLNPNHFLSRAAAVFLTITLLFMIAWPFAMAESSDLPDDYSHAVLYSGGTEIYGGMKIDPTGYIHARYGFTSTRSELTGAKATVILPKRLNAAYAASEPITGTDSKGNRIKVGKLTIDEKLNVKVSFLDLLDSANSGIGAGENFSSEGETGNGSLIMEDTEPASEKNVDGGVATPESSKPASGENADGKLAAPENTEPASGENADGNLAAPENTAPSIEESAGGGVIAPENTAPSGEENTDGGAGATEDTESGGEPLYYVFQPKLRLLSVAGGMGGMEFGGGTDNAPAQIATGNDTSPDAIDPDEIITVEFDVPVIIDTTGLTANKDGSYNVELESGGQKVTVTIEAEAAPVATPAAAQYGVVRTDPTIADMVQVNNTKLFGANGSELNNSSTINKNEVLQLIHYFEADKDTHLKNIRGAMSGDPLISPQYSVFIPVGLALPPTSPEHMLEVMKVDIPNVGTFQYGTLHLDSASNSAYVVFEGDFWDSDYYQSYSLVNCGIDISCMADLSKVGSDGKLSIELSQNNTLIMNVTEDLEPHEIEKSGRYNDETNKITWTVVYTVGNTGTSGNTLDAVTLPINFVDTFNNTEQTYAANSFIINTKNVYTESGNDINEDLTSITDTTKLSFTIDENNCATYGITKPPKVGDKITFKYDTTPTAATLAKSGKNTIVMNNVAILPTGASDNLPRQFLGAGTANISEAQKKWMTKKGVYNSASQAITWTVEVRVKDATAKNLVFTDTLPAGVTLDGVNLSDPSLDNPKLEVKYGTSALTKSSLVNYTYTSNTPPAGDVLKFDLPLDGTSYATSYTITYTTTIDDKEFISGHGAAALNYINNAAISGSSFAATLATTNLEAKVGIVPVGVKMIEKDYVANSYNETTHHITWQVTVNPHGAEIATGAVTDVIQSGQKYVEGSFKITENPTNFTVTPSNPYVATISGTSPPASGLYFTVDGLKGPLVFEFKTEVLPSSLAYNESTTFSNTAEFNGSGKYNNNPFVSIKVQDSASHSVPRNVITKGYLSGETYAKAYKYDTKTISWMVEVNKYKIPMSNVKLEDNLKNYMKLRNVTVKDAAGTPYDGDDSDSIYDYTYSYTYDENADSMLTIDFTDNSGKTICDKNTVFVFIEVDIIVDKLDMNNKKTTSIPNTATLKYNTDGKTGNSTSSTPTAATVNNDLLAKGVTAVYNPSTNKISYNIKVNAGMLTLENCTLTDKIADELKLDEGSMKLYEALVDASGGLTKKNPNSPVNFTWDYDLATRTFTAYIPDGSTAYILEYDCFVVSLKSVSAQYPITNTVTFKGDHFNEISASAPTSQVNYKTWANAYQTLLVANASLTITKVDSIHENIPIAGVTFGLYAPDSSGNEILVATQTTTAQDGKLTFDWLNPNVTYRLEEISAAAGYNIDPDTDMVIENGDRKSLTERNVNGFTVNSNTGITITNRPVSYPVEFQKVNYADTSLTGAKFKITEKTSNQPPYTAEVTSVNGAVIFDVPVGNAASVTYKLEETAPAPHHLLNNTEYELTVYDGGRYTIENMTTNNVYDSTVLPQKPFKIVNEYDPVSRTIKADVYFRKINDVRLSRLNGATFQITEDISVHASPLPSGYQAYTDVSTSTGDGLVMFRDVPVGLYEMKEISPTPHYVSNGDTYIVTVNRDKSFRIADKNGSTLYDSKTHAAKGPWKLENTYSYNPTNPLHKTISINFNKIRSGSNAGLGGAVFQIDEDTYYHPNSPGLYHYTATSAANGLVTFANVNVGLYTLKETAAPPGYIKDDTVYTLIVYAGSSYRIVNPDGKTVYDSKTASSGNFWAVENVYSPVNSSSSGGSSTTKNRRSSIPFSFTPVTPVTPTTPTASPTMPSPTNPEHTLVSDDGGKTYIELDDNGVPVGRWVQKKNDDGQLVWIYEEFPPLAGLDFKDKSGTHPDTGDSSRIFWWILSFYTSAAVLIALFWTSKKNKPWR